MKIDVSIVIALVTVSLSCGMYLGMFTARFMSKKDCAVHRNDLYDKLDDIKGCLIGGEMVFELRQVKRSKSI